MTLNVEEITPYSIFNFLQGYNREAFVLIIYYCFLFLFCKSNFCQAILFNNVTVMIQNSLDDTIRSIGYVVKFLGM